MDLSEHRIRKPTKKNKDKNKSFLNIKKEEQHGSHVHSHGADPLQLQYNFWNQHSETQISLPYATMLPNKTIPKIFGSIQSNVAIQLPLARTHKDFKVVLQAFGKHIWSNVVPNPAQHPPKY